jgi:hypothetical protein
MTCRPLHNCAVVAVVVAQHPLQPLRLDERVPTRDVAVRVGDPDVSVIATPDDRPRGCNVCVAKRLSVSAEELCRSQRS